MPNADLKFLSLSGPQSATRGLRGQEAQPPALTLALPSGTVRRVPVDRHQLLQIIEQAAVALRALDRQEQADAQR